MLILRVTNGIRRVSNAIGIEKWRAGIVFKRPRLLMKVSLNIPLLQIMASVLYCFADLYLFVWITAVILPLAVMITSFSSCFAENRFCNLEELQDPVFNCIKIFTYVLATVYFAVDCLIEVLKSNFGQVSKSPVNYKKVLMIMQSIEYTTLSSTLSCERHCLLL